MMKFLKAIKFTWFILCFLALGAAGWLTHRSTPWHHLELPGFMQNLIGEKVFELWLPGLAVLAVWGIISTVWLLRIALSSWVNKKRRAKWMAEN